MSKIMPAFIVVRVFHPFLVNHCLTRVFTAVRVEWVKARARKRRWVEEVALLKEEMRRVRRYLEWEIDLWEGRSHGWFGLQPDIQAGIIGYAHRQAHWRGVLLKSFSDMWDQPAFEAARNAALESVVVLFD
jgi:hypothetical protein